MKNYSLQESQFSRKDSRNSWKLSYLKKWKLMSWSKTFAKKTSKLHGPWIRTLNYSLAKFTIKMKIVSHQR